MFDIMAYDTLLIRGENMYKLTKKDFWQHFEIPGDFEQVSETA